MRVLTILLLTPLAAAAQAPATVTEWPVPWEQSRPRDPMVAPDGRVWFVGQAGNYLAVLDPATGAITRYPMPEADLTDPHTLTFDRAGNLWFTLQGSNAVGHLNATTGAIRIVRMPNPGSRPYGIVMDSKDRPWFVEFGANRIGTIDPGSYTLREYTIPDPGARPRRLVITPDDRIFAGDYARGKLVALDPATGTFEEWQNPAGARSAPYAMAGDDRCRDHRPRGARRAGRRGGGDAVGDWAARTATAHHGNTEDTE